MQNLLSDYLYHMKSSLLVRLLIFLSAPALPQEDTVHLEDVTISVTPFEQRLSESTGSLSIISPALPDAVQTINLADELNTAPGVFMASGTYTTNRLTIRGVGSRTPYSSNRIRAYLEDIPLTNGDGVSTIEDLDLVGISRMEILKGPTSAMYGSGLGGVVRLRAAYPQEQGVSGRVTGRYGSFNTQKYTATASFRNGTHAITGGLARASSDGFRQNNRYTRNQLFLHGRSGKRRNTFTWHLLGTSLYAEIPSSLNETDFSEHPEQAASNWLAVGGYEKYTRVMAGGGWTHSFNRNWDSKLVLFGAYHNPYELRPFNILDEWSATGGLRNFIRYRSEKLDMEAGIELFHEHYEWKIIENPGGEAGSTEVNNAEKRQYANLFSHLHWTPVEKLNLEAGINVNVLSYRLHTIYHINNEDQSGSYSYPPVVSPRIGVNYEVWNDQFLHGSVGHGFSAPSLEETLLPDGLVNTDLLPEEGWNLDLGIRGWAAGDRWYYDVTAYTIYIRNMLVTKRITEEIFTGINAGSTRLSGIEVFNRLDIGPGTEKSGWHNRLEVSLFLNNNRFTQFVDDGADHSGNTLPGIPVSTFYAKLSSGFGSRLMMTTEVRKLGQQYMNDANTEVYSGHTLVNIGATLMAGKDLWPVNVRISGGVKNLLDTHYAAMILVNAPSFGGAPPRYFYPGEPRNLFVSLTLKF